MCTIELKSMFKINFFLLNNSHCELMNRIAINFCNINLVIKFNVRHLLSRNNSSLERHFFFPSDMSLYKRIKVLLFYYYYSILHYVYTYVTNVTLRNRICTFLSRLEYRIDLIFCTRILSILYICLILRYK